MQNHSFYKAPKSKKKRAKHQENYDKAKLKASGLWDGSNAKSKVTVTHIEKSVPSAGE